APVRRCNRRASRSSGCRRPTCSPRVPRCCSCTSRRWWSAIWSNWCWHRVTRDATTPNLASASPGARAREARSRWSDAHAHMRGWRVAITSRPMTSVRLPRTCCATASCPATKPPPKVGMAIVWSANCWRRCRCRESRHRGWSGATGVTDGIIPTLAELVALRALAGGRRNARLGRHGISGQSLSPLRGRGMEYAESREYIAGDDARHIDWRVTARTGRAHTKVYQAERERLSLIVADTAPSLYFGTRVRFKSVQAARAGAI